MYGAAVNWSGLGGKSGVIRVARFHRGFWESLAETELSEGIELIGTYTISLVVGTTMTATLKVNLGVTTTTIGTARVTIDELKGDGPGFPFNSWGLTGIMSYYSALKISDVTLT